MVKDANSIYAPMNRRGGWWKLKPEYRDADGADELDLLILGVA